MKKKYIIILSLVISILLIVGGFYLCKILAKENSIDVSKDEVDHVEINKSYNIAKTNAISQYIPKNITEVNLINYMSDKDNPTTYIISEISEIERFMNLLLKQNWQEVDKSERANMEGYFWKISIKGDTEFLMEAKGIGGLNSNYGILSTKINNEEKVYFIDKNAYLEILTFTNEKYYLHESDLELPSQDKCYTAQKVALEGLTKEEKENIQINIRYIHDKLERELLDGVRLIKDPNSPYWEDFTSYGVFTDPFTGTKVDNGGRFLYVLDELDKIKDISKNEDVRDDLQKAYDLLKEGMTEHNLKKCFESHKIIHDYDYWIINTPVHLKYESAGWEGTTTFFGKTSIIK